MQNARAGNQQRRYVHPCLGSSCPHRHLLGMLRASRLGALPPKARAKTQTGKPHDNKDVRAACFDVELGRSEQIRLQPKDAQKDFELVRWLSYFLQNHRRGGIHEGPLKSLPTMVRYTSQLTAPRPCASDLLGRPAKATGFLLRDLS